MKSYNFCLIMIWPSPVSFDTKSEYRWQMQIMQIVLSQIHLRYLFSVWPLESYLASLCLSLSTCNRKIIIFTSEFLRELWDNICKIIALVTDTCKCWVNIYYIIFLFSMQLVLLFWISFTSVTRSLTISINC